MNFMRHPINTQKCVKSTIKFLQLGKKVGLKKENEKINHHRKSKRGLPDYLWIGRTLWKYLRRRIFKINGEGRNHLKLKWKTERKK